MFMFKNVHAIHCIDEIYSLLYVELLTQMRCNRTINKYIYDWKKNHAKHTNHKWNVLRGEMKKMKKTKAANCVCVIWLNSVHMHAWIKTLVDEEREREKCTSFHIYDTRNSIAFTTFLFVFVRLSLKRPTWKQQQHQLQQHQQQNTCFDLATMLTRMFLIYNTYSIGCSYIYIYVVRRALNVLYVCACFTWFQAFVCVCCVYLCII